jgi:ATP-dependent protease HslVU (ClpYQ) peptidase subunit
MSVVVAIKKDGIIYMGADSQVTKGGTRTTLSNPNNYKIWAVSGADHALMGCVGTLRAANIMKVADGLIPEIVELKNMVDFKFVVKRLVPRMMEELEGYKQLTKNDDGVPCMDSSFLFAYKDKLFSIEHYGSVIEVDDFCAIGSGAPEAMGSLFSTVNVDDPIKRIQDAIKSSATHDIYVDYPIVISSTENTEFKVFYEKDLAVDQQSKTSK